MFQKIKRKLKEKNGNVSIVVALLVLIGMSILFTMYDFTTRTWVLQEVRGIMESVANTTLVEVIDKNYLKDEIFSVQTGQGGNLAIDTGELTSPNNQTTSQSFSLSSQVRSKIESTYRQQLNAQVGTGGLITGVEVKHINSYVSYDEWGVGNNTSGKKRAYIVLDSVVSVDVTASQTYEVPLQLSTGEFSDVKTGSTFTVEDVQALDNQTMRIIIRSVNRVVYR